MLNFEAEFLPNKKIIAGCDEAGRGAWAGPLVAACVIMNNENKISEINDSKKLSKQKREFLYRQIIRNAYEIQISVRSVEKLNESNPKEESKLAMSECVAKFSARPEVVITDFEKIYTNIDQINLVKGDEISYNVAAASIVAKVYRDKLMTELATKYPGYGFDAHKGYGTKEHKEAIIQKGVTPIHRIKYKPIKELICKMP